METVTIKGTAYAVLKRETPAEFEARGLKNVAAYMRDAGIAAQLHLKRPNGRTSYHAHEFENGRHTPPMALR